MDPELFKKAKETFQRDVYHSLQTSHKFHRESDKFYDLIIKLVTRIIKNNPTDVLGKSVNNFLKTSMFFRYKMHRQGAYRVIHKIVLPLLNRDHKKVEKDKQKKLLFLANKLEKVRRITEAHVVRIIVKPHLQELGLEWSGMMVMEKFRTVIKPF